MNKLSKLLVIAVVCVLSLSLTKADDQTYIYIQGKKLDNDPNYLYIGQVDKNIENYRILNFDEPTFLSLCDTNREICLQLQVNSEHQSMKTYHADSNWDSYLSTTRCGKGVVASEKTSPNGNLYKYCEGYTADAAQKNTYQLPPDLCQTTCDKDDECVGYSVDTQGQNCVTYKGNQYHNYNSYIYMPKTDTVMSPYKSILKMKALAQNVTLEAF